MNSTHARTILKSDLDNIRRLESDLKKALRDADERSRQNTLDEKIDLDITICIEEY